MSDAHDTPKDDPELASWAADFRSERGPAIAVDEIFAQVRRDTWRARVEWTVQIAALLFSVGVYLWLVVRMHSAVQTVLSAIVVPTLIATFCAFAYLRWSDRRGGDPSGAVASHVAALLARRRTSLRIVRINGGVLAFLALVFWVWLPFFVHAHAERYAAEPWRLAIGAGAALVIFGFAAWRLAQVAKNTRAELARWEKVEKSLAE